MTTERKQTDFLKPQWLEYRLRVIPADAGPVQVEGCRLSFYAGAVCMFHLIMSELTDAGVTGEDIETMQAIHLDLMEFVKEVKNQSGGGR